MLSLIECLHLRLARVLNAQSLVLNILTSSLFVASTTERTNRNYVDPWLFGTRLYTYVVVLFGCICCFAWVHLCESSCRCYLECISMDCHADLLRARVAILIITIAASFYPTDLH